MRFELDVEDRYLDEFPEHVLILFAENPVPRVIRN